MEFLNIIFWIIGLITMWRMISLGFALGHRIAVASEATALSTSALYYALTPEAKERADAILQANAKEKTERNNALAARKDKRFFIGIIVVVILVMLWSFAGRAAEQQTRAYDARGNSIGTAVPQGQGSTRYYDASGRSLGTSTTTGKTTTFYGPGGNVTGRTVAPGRR